MAAPTLFLAGDVMTGRGIDQVLPHPVGRTVTPAVRRISRDGGVTAF